MQEDRTAQTSGGPVNFRTRFANRTVPKTARRSLTFFISYNSLTPEQQQVIEYLELRRWRSTCRNWRGMEGKHYLLAPRTLGLPKFRSDPGRPP